MDDHSFLTSMAADDSTGTLLVLLPNGSVCQVHNVSPFTILDKCPLLYHAFEFRANALRQANIEATSASAVLSLLRFLYTGNYLPGSPKSERELLINHAEAFKMGQDYDVPELQVAAYVNFTHTTELACCFATPPVDLCSTVRFLYEHLADQKTLQDRSLLDTLLHYCLSMFAYQGLAKNEEFRKVIWDLPVFHKDLCRLSMQRNFEVDGASELMCLPVSYAGKDLNADLNNRALGDFQFELWSDTETPCMDSDSDPEGSTAIKRKPGDGDFQANTNLPHGKRPYKKIPPVTEPIVTDSENSCDEGGFTLVHRPKYAAKAASERGSSESAFSSPELVAAPSPQIAFPTDELIEADQEDWDLV